MPVKCLSKMGGETSTTKIKWDCKERIDSNKTQVVKSNYIMGPGRKIEKENIPASTPYFHVP